MKESDILKEKTAISCFGVSENNKKVLKILMDLIPQMKDRITMLPNNDYMRADLVFLDADNPEAVTLWRQNVQNKRYQSTIIITNKETLKAKGLPVVKKPLSVKGVGKAIESILSTKQTRKSKSTQSTKIVTPVVLKVLVVDDSFPVRKYMEQKLPTLIDVSLELDFAESGQDSVGKVKNKAHDVVFMDVIMPGTDGYKVCKWIKSVRPKTKVIMLTSKSSPFDKIKGAMSGCDAYLTKPPEDNKLAKALKSIITLNTTPKNHPS